MSKDPKSAPVALPVGSFDSAKLAKDLTAAGGDPVALAKAVSAGANTKTTESMAGYRTVEVADEAIGVTENRRLYFPPEEAETKPVAKGKASTNEARAAGAEEDKGN